jgi:beta-galactosidase
MWNGKFSFDELEHDAAKKNFSNFMSNYSRFASFVAALCFAASVSGAAEPSPGPREIIPFDTGWRFWLGDDPAARQPGFDDSSWRTLDVPHDWSIEAAVNKPPEGEHNGGYFSHGIGWYRKSFTLSPDDGKKVVIEFDGVYMNSEVWINGQFLGRRPYGFIGFRYDLTEFLKTNGSPNVLAVRVDDSLEPALRWYAGSGIYRHVRLLTTGFTHFRLDGGVHITTPKISAKQAVVEADYVIDAHFFSEEARQAWLKDNWNAKRASREVILRSAVFAPDGTVVASTESNLTLDSMQPDQRTTQQLTVPNPLLWSDKTPELYKLRSSLILGDHTLDETTTTFGIRKLEFIHDRGLFVNGQSTKLKGVCIHQDAGSFGNAVPIEVWAYRLGLLKEMGCNAIRPSHHPFAPEFYDLCDQMGFYVFDEAFDEWTRDWPYNYSENPRGKSQYGYHLYFNQWHETDLRAMLRRDRNHPSVVLWSIGNEIPNQMDRDGYKIAKELVAICHEEDPTRPATSACDQSFVSSRNGFMDALDIGGYNYIDRLYSTNTYAPEHKRFPHRLFLGTETTQQVHNWLGVRDNAYVIGDFIWTGIDYFGESGAFPRRGSSSGEIDIAGGKKPGFYQRAAYWSDDPVLQILVLASQNSSSQNPAGGGRRGGPSFGTWNGTTNSQLTVRAVANCEEVELFLNDRSLGRHAVSRNLYYNDWSVPYAPGVLSAVGYSGGRPVATNDLRTAGAAARLQITPLKLAVPGELAFYEVNVVDEAGLVVPNATPAVTVQVEGAGRLIGLDAGDLNYTGLFKTDTRNAYQGRLLATVQRTAPTGEILITASSPQLPTTKKGNNP